VNPARPFTNASITPKLSEPGANSLGVLRWQDELQVAAMLARAFADDPLVAAICKAPVAVRQERMRWNFRVAVRSHYLAAQPAWTMVDSQAAPVAVALVTRPRAQVGMSPDIFFSLRCLFHIGLRTGVRGLEAAHAIASHLPGEPFTYLRTLGVEPSLQGRGLGSRLVEQVIRAAPPILPVYLETAKQRNLSFYTGHGFQSVGEFACLGVPVWRLLLPARA
jgi:GNAT superfamily N-acetyltransferase